MNLWEEVARIQRENGVWWCEVLDADGKKHKGCTNRFEQSHHALFPQQRARKEREWRRFLDHPLNHASSCSSCNVSHRAGDSDAARMHYFDKQVERYGKTAVSVWLMTAPLDIQERHEWRRYWSRVNT